MHFGVKLPSLDKQANMSTLVNLAATLCPGGYICTDFVYVPQHTDASGFTYPAHVVSTDRSNENTCIDQWATYDAMNTAIVAAGMKFLPNVHTVSIPPPPGFAGAQWPISGPPDFQDYKRVCLSLAYRYKINTIELWNEPNTNTGNLAGGMTPYIMVNLIQAAAKPLRDTRYGPGVANVLGPTMGSFDLAYLNSLTAYTPSWPDGLTHISAHVYPGADLPNAGHGFASWPRQPGTLADLQAYMLANTRYTGTMKYAVTEAAYSGKAGAPPPPNSWSTANQNVNESSMVQILYNNNCDIYLHFQLIDDSLQSYNPNYIDPNTGQNLSPFDPPFYVEGMGVTSTDGLTQKPLYANYPILQSTYGP